MASIRDIYPSNEGNFLSVAKLRSEGLEDKPLTIALSESVELQDSQTQQVKKKLKLSFSETTSVLLLNRTNADAIAEKFGDDFTKWMGKKIKLLVINTNFKGQKTPGMMAFPLI